MQAEQPPAVSQTAQFRRAHGAQRPVSGLPKLPWLQMSVQRRAAPSKKLSDSGQKGRCTTNRYVPVADWSADTTTSFTTRFWPMSSVVSSISEEACTWPRLAEATALSSASRLLLRAASTSPFGLGTTSSTPASSDTAWPLSRRCTWNATTSRETSIITRYSRCSGSRLGCSSTAPATSRAFSVVSEPPRRVTLTEYVSKAPPLIASTATWARTCPPGSSVSVRADKRRTRHSLYGSTDASTSTPTMS
mmetsp:Transcript_26963/g.68565  ORF Transcript_26963/g.68565 Transcript_26963/m.68565 type:complete len:248 (+) Transcript_26963:412-1155(+)